MKRLIPDVGAMLREGHFGNPAAMEIPQADPVTVTQMLMDIDRIKAYDRNPRVERNPRYEEIKASIRAQRGLNNALEITRRPGDELYMIRAGGNTRLQILKELAEETAATEFRKVHCLFHPWTTEAAVLTAHMIENELRGDMVLIDKALGLKALKQEMEQEAGQTLSRSELERRLAAVGYTISRRHIIRFEYAAEILYPLIPSALRAGMGQPPIDTLRALAQGFESYWTDAGQDPEAFRSLWAETLQDNDGPDFDPLLIKQALESRFAAALDHPVSRIRLEIDAGMSSRRRQTEDMDGDDQDESGAPSHPQGGMDHLSTPGSEPPLVVPPPAPISQAPERDHAGEFDPTALPEAGPDLKRGLPPSGSSPNEPPLPDILPAPHPGPTDLKSLRARNYTLALQLAQRYHMGESLMLLPGKGMGFLIDLPPEHSAGNISERAVRRWLWWMLYALSEFHVDTGRAKYYLENVVPNYLNSDDVDFSLSTQPDLTLLVNQLLTSPVLPDQDFEALCELMRSCRRTRQECPDPTGDMLWRGGCEDDEEEYES